MVADPIVEEVRAIREQLAGKFNFDIRKIIEDARTRQATSKFKIVSFQQPHTTPQSSGIGSINVVADRGSIDQVGGT